MVSRGPVTCGEVLDDAGCRGVEDDVGTLVQVMQVIATVKSSVAKHVVESQLLHPHTEMKAALRGTAHTAGAATPLMGLQGPGNSQPRAKNILLLVQLQIKCSPHPIPFFFF